MVVAYHIRSNYPFELGAPTTTWARVLAYQEHTGLPNVLHIIDTERPDQYRGVSYLAQVIEPLLQIRRYTESELMAAVVESFIPRSSRQRLRPTRTRSTRRIRTCRENRKAPTTTAWGRAKSMSWLRGKRGVCKPNAPERQF